MKPNPVKKTVEYCNTSGGRHCSHAVYNAQMESVLCNKHGRTLRGGADDDIKRPEWCTDETIVKVKIKPKVVAGKEYCFAGLEKCSALVQTGNTGAQCVVSGENLTINYDYWLRPEACRKLEVE